MSTANYDVNTGGVGVAGGIAALSSNTRPLHRLREVRHQQGVSLRSAARKLGVSIQDVRHQESPGTDLPISTLLRWQAVLEVPLSDLLVDCDGPLSDPVEKRAAMLRVMKTAKALSEATAGRQEQKVAEMLVDQLIALMPELAEVSAWHTVGQRRTQDEVGRIVERTIPDTFFSSDSVT
ncbi:MAG: helix-turn-helix transcriptional regulator [Planctomycetota bacterium]